MSIKVKTFALDDHRISFIAFTKAWQLSTSSSEVCQRLEVPDTERNRARLAARASRWRKKFNIPYKRYGGRSKQTSLDAQDAQYLTNFINSLTVG